MANIDQTSYNVLRHGGASRERACAELDVSIGRGQVLETLFRGLRGGPGPDAMRPRFARHDLHVTAVQAAGGYAVLR